jgi:hypothetical protein
MFQWKSVEIALPIPLLLVSMTQKETTEELPVPCSFLIQPDDLHSLLSADGLALEKVDLLAPARINGTSRWSLDPLEELWRCTEPRREDTIAWLFQLHDRAYAESIHQTPPADLRRERLIFRSPPAPPSPRSVDVTHPQARIAAMIARFPRIFKGKEPELGITTGPGWDANLDEFFYAIDQLLTVEEARTFQIEQIKSKSASLKVHYSLADAHEVKGTEVPRTSSARAIKKAQVLRSVLDLMIFQAAKICRQTCERCGRPGVLREGEWLHIACDECERLIANWESGT